MAIQQTYFATRELSKSALLNGGTITRGLRVTINAADGSVSLSTSGVRGDFVTTEQLTDSSGYLTAAGLNQPGTVALLQSGGIIVMQSISAEGTVGATAYAAANGEIDTSGSVIIGKYMNTCAAGDLVSVLVENPL